MGIQVTEVSQGKQPWEKEFIDIEFDGKTASEMGFLVTNDGMYQQNIYTDFENEVSTVNGVDGQYFWGTVYSPKVIDYTFSTDEINEAQFTAMKHWLRPGHYGKLIECTYANRYCYCRIGETPQFEFIPFAKQSTFNGITYKERIYKGSITVQFVLDTPWYYAEKQYIEENINDEQNIIEMFQDNLPLISAYANATDNLTCVVGNNTLIVTVTENNSSGEGTTELTPTLTATATISDDYLFNYNDIIKCFNPSDLYTKPKITLLIPQSDLMGSINSSTGYFTLFYDSISAPVDENGLVYTYNSILQSDSKSIESQNDFIPSDAAALYYTSPSIIYLANRAIQIATNYKNSTNIYSLIELEERLRNEITDYDLLAWIIFIFNCWINLQPVPTSYDSVDVDSTATSYYNADNGQLQGEWLAAFKEGVQNFFNDFETSEGYPFKLIIDSANANATFTYQYNIGYISTDDNGTTSYSIEKKDSVEKNCGEIMLTSYLKLAGQDKIDQTGKINTCHALCFYRGLSNQLPSNVKIKVEYEYQYA